MSDTTNIPQNTNPQPTKPRHTCPVCQVTYKERAPFEQHVSRHTSTEHPYICFNCGFPYSTKEALDYHTTNVCNQERRVHITDMLHRAPSSAMNDLRNHLQMIYGSHPALQENLPENLAENLAENMRIPRENVAQRNGQIHEATTNRFRYYFGNQGPGRHTG